MSKTLISLKRLSTLKGLGKSGHKKLVKIVISVDVGLVQDTTANTRAGTIKACNRAGISPPIGGQIAQRVGPFKIAAAGLLAAAGFMFVYGQLPTGQWIVGISLFHAVTDGITIAAPGVAVAMAVPPERQAGAHGLLAAGQSLLYLCRSRLHMPDRIWECSLSRFISWY